MDREKSLSSSKKGRNLNLPNIPDSLSNALKKGQTISMAGTNVVRVPFGIRHPLKIRPKRPEHWATLVIPLQNSDDPTPPPAAA